jgi:hypothetical protein
MEPVIEVLKSPNHEGRKRLFLDVQASLDAVLTHPVCPMFLQNSLRGKVTWQKRNEFNIDRTLRVPGMAPQWVGALLAWGVWAVLEDGSEILLAEMLESGGKEVAVKALSLSLDVQGRLWAEARTGSTPNDIPTVWAMAVVDLADGRVQNARIAVSGVWRQSVALAQSASLLVGNTLEAEVIENVTVAVVEETTPKGDYRGSVEYRKAMAGVMTHRALQACLEGVEV